MELGAAIAARCYASGMPLFPPCGWGKEGVFVLSAPLVPKSHIKAIIAPGANLGVWRELDGPPWLTLDAP